MSTPEGKVKAAVKKMLHEFDDVSSVLSPHPKLYQFWPVQNGMGSPSLDCLVCYCGVWIGIETKAPGKHPTPRQVLTIEHMRAAGGLVFVVSDKESIDAVRNALKMIGFSQCKP